MIKDTNDSPKSQKDSNIIIMEKTPSEIEDEEKVNLCSFSNTVSNSVSNPKINEQRRSMTKYLLLPKNLEQLQQLDKYSPVKRKRDDSKLIDEDIMDKIELMKVIGLQKVRYSQGNIENSNIISLHPIKHHSSNYILKSRLSSSNSIDNISFTENDTINLTNSIFIGLSNNDISQSNSLKKQVKIKEIKEEEKRHEGSIINEEMEEHSNHSKEERDYLLNNTDKEETRKPHKRIKNLSFSDQQAVMKDSDSEVDSEDEKKKTPTEEKNEPNTLSISPINNNINITMNTTNIFLNQALEKKKPNKEKKEKKENREDLGILQQLISISLSKDISKLLNSSQSIDASTEYQANIENILKKWQYGDMVKNQNFSMYQTKSKGKPKTEDLTSKNNKKINVNENNAKTENLDNEFKIKLIDISPRKILSNVSEKSKEVNAEPNPSPSPKLNQLLINPQVQAEELQVADVCKEVLTEEETFFRFNKKGWICIYCANFNFENRLECNRCRKAKNTRKKYFDEVTGEYVETKKELTVNKNKKTQHSPDPIKSNNNKNPVVAEEQKKIPPLSSTNVNLGVQPHPIGNNFQYYNQGYANIPPQLQMNNQFNPFVRSQSMSQNPQIPQIPQIPLIPQVQSYPYMNQYQFNPYNNYNQSNYYQFPQYNINNINTVNQGNIQNISPYYINQNQD